MALCIHFTVFDGQKSFGIFGGHAEEGSHPHPEESSRAAGMDGGGDAYDIAGADGGRQRGTECLEAVDIPFAGVLRTVDEAERLFQAEHLQKAEPYGEQNPRAHEEHQKRRPPDKAVNGIQ